MYGIPLPGAPGAITAGISISSQLKAYGSSKLPPGELTALHIAAERGSAELIRVLVGAGAKVNIQGDRGMPPLHVAVWEGNTTAVVSLLAAKVSEEGSFWGNAGAGMPSFLRADTIEGRGVGACTVECWSREGSEMGGGEFCRPSAEVSWLGGCSWL